jgi:predicted metal-dependent HD superfamily phosphohydrolase
MVNEFVFSGFMKKVHFDYLKDRWFDFSEDKETFEFVMQKHSEPHRFYHNTSHLKSLLEALELFPLERHQKGFLTLMVFFHDLEYDVHAKDNEEQSAEHWNRYCEKHNLTKHLQKLGEEIILATKGHSGDSKPLKDIFLDLDLSILGAVTESYLEYEENIRKEYGFVPEDLFNQERAKIMKKLVGSYKTQTAIEQWQKLRDINLEAYK